MSTKAKENGRKAEIAVKEQLWRNGYSVKDVARVADYDLLVNDHIKVEVKSAEYKQLKKGLVWDIQQVRIKPNGADILAIVLTTPLNDTMILYTKWSANVIKAFDNGGVMYGDKIKNGNRVVCDLRLTPDTLKNCFTQSPAQVLKN
jgi:hypothetical protein